MCANRLQYANSLFPDIAASALCASYVAICMPELHILFADVAVLWSSNHTYCQTFSNISSA